MTYHQLSLNYSYWEYIYESLLSLFLTFYILLTGESRLKMSIWLHARRTRTSVF